MLGKLRYRQVKLRKLAFLQMEVNAIQIILYRTAELVGRPDSLRCQKWRYARWALLK